MRRLASGVKKDERRASPPAFVTRRSLPFEAGAAQCRMALRGGHSDLRSPTAIGPDSRPRLDPDGSSDSAVIEIQGADPQETRTAVVELDGVNRIISARILQPSELQEYHDQTDASGG